MYHIIALYQHSMPWNIFWFVLCMKEWPLRYKSKLWAFPMVLLKWVEYSFPATIIDRLLLYQFVSGKKATLQKQLKERKTLWTFCIFSILLNKNKAFIEEYNSWWGSVFCSFPHFQTHVVVDFVETGGRTEATKKKKRKRKRVSAFWIFYVK